MNLFTETDCSYFFRLLNTPYGYHVSAFSGMKSWVAEPRAVEENDIDDDCYLFVSFEQIMENLFLEEKLIVYFNIDELYNLHIYSDKFHDWKLKPRAI